MRPTVDEDLCIGCGRCEEICPAVFRVGDDGFSHVIAADACAEAGCCEDAADECPVDAISLGWSSGEPARRPGPVRTTTRPPGSRPGATPGS